MDQHIETELSQRGCLLYDIPSLFPPNSLPLCILYTIWKAGLLNELLRSVDDSRFEQQDRQPPTSSWRSIVQLLGPHS